MIRGLGTGRVPAAGGRVGLARSCGGDLRAAGYRVRIYVPYGREWYPYLTRRLAERPANLLFLARSLWAEKRGNGARAA